MKSRTHTERNFGQIYYKYSKILFIYCFELKYIKKILRIKKIHAYNKIILFYILSDII